MKEILGAILHSIVWIIFVGIFGAALVKFQVSLALRLFLFAAAVSIYMLFRDLHQTLEKIYETQGKLVYWLRANFIANEMSRLEPENKVPSQDILIDDLKLEKKRKDSLAFLEREEAFSVWGLLFHGAWSVIVLVHIIGPLVICSFLVYYWDQLVSLFP
jgi:hypothetical protein